MKRLLYGIALAGVVAVGRPGMAEMPLDPAPAILPVSSSLPWVEPPAAAASAKPAAASGRASRRSARAHAGAIKPGRWEFTASLQTPVPPPLPPGVRLPQEISEQAGAAKTTYSGCIAIDNAVPVQLGPQCSLERSRRRGGRITWEMACANTDVRAAGVARYTGDTMEATMTSRLPGADGGVTDVVQHIAGRYVEPCPEFAESPAPPASPAAPQSPASAPPAPARAAAAAPNGPPAPAAETRAAGPKAAAPRHVQRPTRATQSRAAQARSSKARSSKARAAKARSHQARSHQARAKRHVRRSPRRHYRHPGAYTSWHAQSRAGGSQALLGPSPYSDGD